jgi:hypothetical protein
MCERYSGMIYDVKTPKKWNEDLAYLFGLLIGDGSLPLTKSVRPNGRYQTRYAIYFVSNSEAFLKDVYVPLFKRVFGLNLRIETRKDKVKELYVCRIESRKIYEFLQKKGYIAGRKARIAKIPDIPKKYHPYLLAGLLDTDGGKKGNGFGLSTASPYLATFCEDMFKRLRFRHNSCPWHYKDHIYHQIYVPKSEMHKILKAIPIKNKDKITFINNASVAQLTGISKHCRF